MKQHHRISTGKVVALGVLACAPLLLGHAHSQDGISKSAKIFPHLNRSASFSRTPSTSNQTLATHFVSYTPAPVQDDEETDPVVLAVRESKPSSPAELMQAVETLMNIDRFDEAQTYIDQLNAAGLDDAARFRLQREVGSDLLYQISRSAKIDESGREFARTTLAAAFQMARAPARLDQLVRDLQAADARTQNRAFFELQSVGESAVMPILRAGSSTNSPNEQQRLVNALVKLKDASSQPLVGALRADNEQIRILALQALGELKIRAAAHSMVRSAHAENASEQEQTAARAALTRLFGFPPNRIEAMAFLKQEVESYLNGNVPGRPQLEGQTVIWLWDEVGQTLRPNLFPDNIAGLVYASEAAADLYELDPTDAENRKLHVATLLETEKRISGASKPIVDEQLIAAAKEMGVGELEEMIKWSISNKRAFATMAGAELLGQIGTPSDVLQSQTSKPRILVQLLRHNDRRVRFAATQAIMQLHPTQSYKGASWLIESLLYFISTAGEQRVLIGHPGVAQSRTLAGSLGQFGYEADTSLYGRDLIKQAVSSSDYELILISDLVTLPECNELLQQLRKDPRTSKLPIGLMAEHERLTRARRIVGDDPLSVVMPWPYESSAVKLAVTELNDRNGDDYVNVQERINQSIAALQHLLRIANPENDLDFYEWRSFESAIAKGLYTPHLAIGTSEILGYSGSPLAQRELLDQLNQGYLTLEHRQASAAAFQKAVEARGIMLTSKEVRLQYDRYNASANLDRDTQQLLGGILDTLERAMGYSPSK